MKRKRGGEISTNKSNDQAMSSSSSSQPTMLSVVNICNVVMPKSLMAQMIFSRLNLRQAWRFGCVSKGLSECFFEKDGWKHSILQYSENNVGDLEKLNNLCTVMNGDKDVLLQVFKSIHADMCDNCKCRLAFIRAPPQFFKVNKLCRECSVNVVECRATQTWCLKTYMLKPVELESLSFKLEHIRFNVYLYLYQIKAVAEIAVKKHGGLLGIELLLEIKKAKDLEYKNRRKIALVTPKPRIEAAIGEALKKYPLYLFDNNDDDDDNIFEEKQEDDIDRFQKHAICVCRLVNVEDVALTIYNRRRFECALRKFELSDEMHLRKVEMIPKYLPFASLSEFIEKDYQLSGRKQKLFMISSVVADCGERLEVWRCPTETSENEIIDFIRVASNTHANTLAFETKLFLEKYQDQQRGELREKLCDEIKSKFVDRFLHNDDVGDDNETTTTSTTSTITTTTRRKKRPKVLVENIMRGIHDHHRSYYFPETENARHYLKTVSESLTRDLVENRLPTNFDSLRNEAIEEDLTFLKEKVLDVAEKDYQDRLLRQKESRRKRKRLVDLQSSQ